MNHAIQRSSQYTILSGYKYINSHLGGEIWSIKIIDTIHIVEKMIETKEPKEYMNDKRKIKVTQKLSVLWVQ